MNGTSELFIISYTSHRMDWYYIPLYRTRIIEQPTLRMSNFYIRWYEFSRRNLCII